MPNKEIVRRYIEEVLNTGDVNNIEKFVSADYAEVHNGEHYQIGIDGAKEHILGIRHVYPDLKLNIEIQISEGEWVATYYSLTGTFQKEWLGLKPTGKQITYTGVNMDKLRDGKIIEHGGAANLFEPLLKAGVIKKKK